MLALGFDAVVLTELLTVHVDHSLGRRLLAAVDLLLHALEALVLVADVTRAERGQIHLGSQQLAQECLVRLEGQRLGQLPADDLLRFPAVPRLGRGNPVLSEIRQGILRCGSRVGS